MNLTQNYLAVEVVTDTMSEGGIVMPEQANQPSKKGTVVLCGPEVESELDVGMTVHFNKFAGDTLIRYNKKNLLVIRDKDVFAYES